MATRRRPRPRRCREGRRTSSRPNSAPRTSRTPAPASRSCSRGCAAGGRRRSRSSALLRATGRRRFLPSGRGGRRSHCLRVGLAGRDGLRPGEAVGPCDHGAPESPPRAGERSLGAFAAGPRAIGETGLPLLVEELSDCPAVVLVIEDWHAAAEPCRPTRRSARSWNASPRRCRSSSRVGTTPSCRSPGSAPTATSRSSERGISASRPTEAERALSRGRRAAHEPVTSGGSPSGPRAGSPDCVWPRSSSESKTDPQRFVERVLG